LIEKKKKGRERNVTCFAKNKFGLSVTGRSSFSGLHRNKNTSP